jgi:hypothetical protein
MSGTYKDVTAIFGRLDIPAYQADGGRLASPVRSEQRKHFSTTYTKCEVFNSCDRAERFGKVQHPKAIVGAAHTNKLFCYFIVGRDLCLRRGTGLLTDPPIPSEDRPRIIPKKNREQDKHLANEVKNRTSILKYPARV